jgi:hypothetical protein
MARPLAKINWEEFDKLAAMQATLEEVSGWFGVSEDTIERACKREKNLSFADYWRQKAGKGRISLRRAQWQNALGGNATLQIWLGKQHLGQRDRFPEEGDVDNPEAPKTSVSITFVDAVPPPKEKG